MTQILLFQLISKCWDWSNQSKWGSCVLVCPVNVVKHLLQLHGFWYVIRKTNLDHAQGFKHVLQCYSALWLESCSQIDPDVFSITFHVFFVLILYMNVDCFTHGEIYSFLAMPNKKGIKKNLHRGAFSVLDCFSVFCWTFR